MELKLIRFVLNRQDDEGAKVLFLADDLIFTRFGFLPLKEIITGIRCVDKIYTERMG